MMKSLIRNILKEKIELLTEITVKDAWEKFYSDKTKFPLLNGDVNLFNALNELIPTNGDNFNKGAFTWLYNLRKAGQLKDEDFYKAKDYLQLFNKFINRIPKENRDLMKLKSLGDLYSLISDFTGDNENQSTSKTQELKDIKKNEVKKVYEDNNWLVMVPLTERASCLIGKGTQWCTAADKSNNMFDSYNKNGHLYVLVDKYEDNKYQIHFESDSLMDEEDRSITGVYFFENIADNGGLQKYFEENIPTFWDFIVETTVDDVYEYGTYSDLFYTALNKCNSKVKERTLHRLRNSGEDEAIYIGFTFEEDPDNISKYDVESLAGYTNEGGNFENIIDHLIEIGYDFGNVDSSDNFSLQSFINGKQLLQKHKLSLDVPYKIDKGKTLTIHKVNFNKEEPTYRVSVEKKGKTKPAIGNINIETLINLIHQGQLFETSKKFIKNVLREEKQK